METFVATPVNEKNRLEKIGPPKEIQVNVHAFYCARVSSFRAALTSRTCRRGPRSTSQGAQGKCVIPLYRFRYRHHVSIAP